MENKWMDQRLEAIKPVGAISMVHIKDNEK